MVIVSLLIVNKEGKIIFSRAFIPITKNDINTFSSFFIRNLNKNLETTLFESNNYRYLFISLNTDTMYLLLITSLNSNIIQDNKILKISYRIFNDCCKEGLNEENIKKNWILIFMYLEEMINNSFIQNENYGDIHTKVEMIKFDKLEFKKMKEKKNEKDKNLLIKQINEFEKIERKKEEEENKKNNNNENKINNNYGINHKIHLNEKFEFVQIERPKIFKTPSGKVVLLSNIEKYEKIQKEKLIKGIQKKKKK